MRSDPLIFTNSFLVREAALYIWRGEDPHNAQHAQRQGYRLYHVSDDVSVKCYLLNQISDTLVG